MKIWILTSHFGSGHASAAQALGEEYLRQGHSVVISDIVELLYPRAARLIYAAFRCLICPHSALYNFLNQFGRNSYPATRTNARVRAALASIDPDAIITTWSGCGRALGQLSLPVHVCITDVGVHTGWLYPYAASFWVAAEQTAAQLTDLGVSPHQIRVRGIPVREKFRTLPEKTTMHSPKELLIMGGGLGIIPWLDTLLEGLENDPCIQLTVVAGKNHRLFRQLKEKHPRVRAIGFVSNLEDYLAQADCLISKPGGISLFESICATTPYIAMCPAFEHELENAAFIEAKQIGLVIRSQADACRQIRELLADQPRWHTYRANMAAWKQTLEANQKSAESELTHAVS